MRTGAESKSGGPSATSASGLSPPGPLTLPFPLISPRTRPSCAALPCTCCMECAVLCCCCCYARRETNAWQVPQPKRRS